MELGHGTIMFGRTPHCRFGPAGAVLVFFLAGTSAAPLNDVTRLTPEGRWVGYATIGIWGLILAPFPHAHWVGGGDLLSVRVTSDQEAVDAR